MTNLFPGNLPFYDSIASSGTNLFKSRTVTASRHGMRGGGLRLNRALHPG